MSFQTELYCWVYQILLEISFQIINMYSISGFYNYCDTSYSRGGVNQMWTLRNSKDLLEYIQSRSLSSCNGIKTLEFSTLCTAIPHSQLNDKLRELVQLCFIKKYHLCRNKYIVLGKDTLILPKSSLKLISSTYSSF